GLDVTFCHQAAMPSRVIGDPHRLRQVLVNLMGNAVKFTECGEVVLHLETQDDPPGLDPGQVRLRFDVQDTGIGVAPERQRDIFSPFVQADGSITRQYGGTGLGLAISARLVELMGGSIELESAPGEGSSFHVHLTLALDGQEPQPTQVADHCVHATIPAPAPAPAPTPNPNPAPSTPESSEGLRILAVDDTAENLLLLQHFLQKSPHQLVCVDNAGDAMLRLRQEAFDLVLMDVQMPGMDGYQATRAIRAWEQSRPQSAPLPVIAVTAHAFDEDRQASLAAGCDEHMCKPIRKKALLELLARRAALRSSHSKPATVEGLRPSTPSQFGNHSPPPGHRNGL
ncbi:MAG: ATP-binding protein, partial [Magnetococcus sp. WYHC-3]